MREGGWCDACIERHAINTGRVLIILFRVTIYSLAAIGFAALMGGFNVF